MDYGKVILERSLKAITPMFRHLNGDHDWREELHEQAEHGWHLPDEAWLSPADFRKREEELREELKEYVDTWLAAACNYHRWFLDNRKLHGRIVRNLNSIDILLFKRADGGAKILTLPKLATNSLVEHKAAWLFATFITSALHQDILKCLRCGRYILNIRPYKKKAYCSRRCGKALWAIASTNKRREDELEKKLNKAQEALQELGRIRPQVPDWKNWVAKRASVTTRFLTRHINKGTLRVPTAIKQQAKKKARRKARRRY